MINKSIFTFILYLKKFNTWKEKIRQNITMDNDFITPSEKRVKKKLKFITN